MTKEIRYHVRNCVRGFDMIQGIHYDESFAPTPPNETIRTAFALSLWALQQLGIDLKDLDHVEREEWVVGNLFDVVQAFLNSKMDADNPVYIQLPPLWKEYCELRGIEYDPMDLIELGKSQYGQTDAARRWMEMFVWILTEKGGCELIQSKLDPCLFYKRDDEGNLLAIVVAYVDDGYVCGKPWMVRKIMDHLKSQVEIVEVGCMDTHLRVNYHLDKDAIGWYYECEMQEYIDEIVQEFEEYTEMALRDYPSPAVPGQFLMKLEEGEEAIDIGSYHRFMGKLLFAVMKVLPDCGNAIRDLTCHLSNPGEEHWKALEHMIGYLKFHYRPMKLRAPKELRMVTAFDADWGSDKNDRKSISSHLTTLSGTSLLNWQCKKQNSVALSSCDAETQASTPAAQDTVYINNLVEEVMGTIELPSYVYGDNAASLFLARNNQLGQRSKHIDIRDRYLHTLVVTGTVELWHVRSEDNTSDINSKNTTVEVHGMLADKLYEGVPLVHVIDAPDKEDVAVNGVSIVGSKNENRNEMRTADENSNKYGHHDDENCDDADHHSFVDQHG